MRRFNLTTFWTFTGFFYFKHQFEHFEFSRVDLIRLLSVLRCLYTDKILLLDFLFLIRVFWQTACIYASVSTYFSFIHKYVNINVTFANYFCIFFFFAKTKTRTAGSLQCKKSAKSSCLTLCRVCLAEVPGGSLPPRVRG